MYYRPFQGKFYDGVQLPNLHSNASLMGHHRPIPNFPTLELGIYLCYADVRLFVSRKDGPRFTAMAEEPFSLKMQFRKQFH